LEQEGVLKRVTMSMIKVMAVVVILTWSAEVIVEDCWSHQQRW